MGEPIERRRRLLLLNRDLFFGVRLKQLGAELGFDVEIVADAAAFSKRIAGNEFALAIIDINAKPDWDLIAEEGPSGGRTRILAFGPHLDVDGLRAAKAAGVTRVVSNGQFHRDAAALIERYASGTAESSDDSGDDDFPDH